MFDFGVGAVDVMEGCILQKLSVLLCPDQHVYELTSVFMKSVMMYLYHLSPSPTFV